MPVLSTDPDSNFVGHNVTIFCGYNVTQLTSIEWYFERIDSSPEAVYYVDAVGTDSQPYPDFVGHVDGKFVNGDKMNYSLILINTSESFDGSTWTCRVYTSGCGGGRSSNLLIVNLTGKFQNPFCF